MEAGEGGLKRVGTARRADVATLRQLIGVMAVLLAGCDVSLKDTYDEPPLPVVKEDDALRREVAIDVIAIETGMVVAALKRRR